jgi:hypothetical protein
MSDVSDYDIFIKKFFCLVKKLDKNKKFDIITSETETKNDVYSEFCNKINSSIIVRCDKRDSLINILKNKELQNTLEINNQVDNLLDSIYINTGAYDAEDNANQNVDVENNDKIINLKYDKFYNGLYVLVMFVRYNLLIKSNETYIMLNGEDFKWNNMKNIKEDDPNLMNVLLSNDFIKYLVTKTKTNCVVIYKALLWYFRKIFVNSVVYDLLEYYKTSKKEENDPTIDYNSVGSVKISSDYDITLSGNNHKFISLIIVKFSNIIKRVFGNKEDIIFDTNIYGVGFSKKHDKIKNVNYTCDIICNNTQFCITKLNEADEKKDMIDQHTWAFIKLLSNLRVIINKYNIEIKCEGSKGSEMDIYDCLLKDILKTYEYAYKNVYKKNVLIVEEDDFTQFLLKAANTFINNHPKMDEFNDSFHGYLYANLISTADELISQYGINNYISLVNYYGVETYYTRGAFLDVVVNQQSCNLNVDKNVSKVNKDGYLDSFIENCSDYCLHDFKEKYKKRALNALNNLGLESSIVTMFNSIIDEKRNHVTKIIELYAFTLNIFKQTQIQPNIFNYDTDYYCLGKTVFGKHSMIDLNFL